MTNILLPFFANVVLKDGLMLVVLDLPGQSRQSLVMRGVDFDRMVLAAAPETEPVLTLEEQVRQALSKIDQGPRPAPPKEAFREQLSGLLAARVVPGVEVAAPVAPAPSAVVSVTPPASEFDEDEVEALGLQVQPRFNPLKGIVLINEEAGRDGSDMTAVTVAKLVAIIEGRHPDHIKQQAFARLATPPLAKMYQYRHLLTDKIALRIAGQRMKDLGADRSGIGSGFVPADWMLFISGHIGEYGDLMSKVSEITIETARPPTQNFSDAELDAEVAALQQDRGRSVGDLESRFRSGTYSGTENLKE